MSVDNRAGHLNLIPAGVNITVSHLHPKHPTRTYKVVYHGHPLVTQLCWRLRRWVRIRPWVVAVYPDDADPIFIRPLHTLVCGERTFDLIQRCMPDGRQR